MIMAFACCGGDSDVFGLMDSVIFGVDLYQYTKLLRWHRQQLGPQDG
jgi:hypothetical protein